MIQKNNSQDSLIIRSYINQKNDDNLEVTEKQIRRSILANYTIELVTNKINSSKGRKAYLISLFFEASIFLFYSITFFWFLNFQLYKISPSNFSYNGTFPSFDFLYFTLKTITFGDIELVKPISVLARISEICSFFITGIFLLVIFVSIIFSIKQDKMNENVKLTTDLFKSENLSLSQYFKDQFGIDIKSAISEVKNIDESLKNLRKIVEKIF